MTPAVAGLAAALVGSGLLLSVVALTTRTSTKRTARTIPRARVLWTEHRSATVAAIAGLVLAVVTGWWVLVAVLPAAALGLPTVLRRPVRSDVARLSDLESWLRGLAGTLVGGSIGLRQALRDSAHSAPPTLQPSLAAMAARLDAQQPIDAALRGWADDLADPTVDLVVVCLMAEAQRRGGSVTAALERIADTVAEAAADQRQVEAERNGPATTVRWVTIISAVLLTVLVTRSGFAEFYATAIGQVAVAVLAAAYAGCLYWMRKVAKGRPVPRLFRPLESRP